MDFEDSLALWLLGICVLAILLLSVRSSDKEKQAAADAQWGNDLSFAAKPPLPLLTIILMLASIGVALLSSLGDNIGALVSLFYDLPATPGLDALANFEYWRLLTPIFIHFGIIHLVFNMMWLWELGGVIEHRKGRGFLLLFVIAVGIASNTAEYVLGGHALFGGMSGVVYGLLGYVWIHGQRNPNFGAKLHQPIVVLMLVWYVICWTGLLGPIANWAHTFGLGLGIILGLIRLPSR